MLIVLFDYHDVVHYNSFDKVKQSIRNTIRGFYMKYMSFVVNDRIYRQKIHGFFTTSIRRQNLA